jgi:MYXO-CTERM domain-containing protein
MVNATVVHNGTGGLSHGRLVVRNSIFTDNGVGMARAGNGSIASRYNDLFANTTAPYEGVEGGVGDISAAVAFAAAARHDFRLTGVQPTTDRGDPADDFSSEPMPNGARVNMGAFANTATAEVSGAALPRWTTADQAAADGSSGCSVGGRASRSSVTWVLMALAGVVVVRRRKR